MALLSLSQEAENQFLTQSGQETVAISSSVGRGNLSPEETADWIDYFKFYFNENDPKKVRNDLTLVVVFMETENFQAVLSPPVGLGMLMVKHDIETSNFPILFPFFFFFNSLGVFMYP